MPALWGDIEWGEAQWGDGDPIVLGDFVDDGGNDLALPAAINFIGFAPASAADIERNRIYEMHVGGIRAIDASQGGLFWKRFCEGPEIIRRQLEERIDQLPAFWSVTDIPDEYVHLMLAQVGWGKSLSSITDGLTPNEIRRLVANAVRLWKRRGVTGAYIEALNTIVGVDAFEWSWFDKRFVLGQARLGHDQDQTVAWNDAYFLNVASRNLTNIRIADAERALDRVRIRNIVKAWRPTCERVRLSYVEFWDRFVDDSKGWITYDEQVAATTTIEGGAIKLDGATEQHAFPESPALLQLSAYMVRARIRFSDANTSYHGVVTGFNGDFTTAIEFRIYPETNELKIYQNAAPLLTVDLHHDFGFLVYADFWHTLRIEIEDQRIVVFFDNRRVFTGDAMGLIVPGTCGLTHGADTTLHSDYFEILPIPGENDFIDINS